MPATLSIDEDLLALLLHDPTITLERWAVDASCLGTDHDYVPDDETSTPTAEALACCALCPVATDCLAAALMFEAEQPVDLRFGWWGGLGPIERAVLAEGVSLNPIDVEIDVDLLAPRERVSRLRSQNRTVPSIAVELGITERTVYRYLARNAA